MEVENFSLSEFSIDNNVKKRNGGEAIVFKAWHPRLGEVAVKEWTSDAYDSYNEVSLLIKNCNHPNIIQFVGNLMNNESNYIGYVMPYMSMGSLEDGKVDPVIHNKRKNYDAIYTDEQKANWITQICYGLSHLHFKKIIHRDIKPRKSYDDVKLSDFGMARSVEKKISTLTKGLGTLYYMAPEMLKREGYDASVDIYSLSITIWEILYRRTPYDSLIHELDLLIRISNGERPQLNNNLSKEVSDLLTSCWDADASKRPTVDKVLETCRKPTFSLSTSTTEKPIENVPEEQAILLLGGYDKMGGDNFLMLENNEQNWKQSNIKLPYAIRDHGAQSLNNNLYTFGGYNKEEGVLNWTYMLSKSLKWEKMAEMNQKRLGVSSSSVVLNNQIWVCGGYNGSETLKSVEMEMNNYRSRAAAVVVNGKIFCSGGSDDNSVECYDPFSDVWTFICNMPQNIEGHGAVKIDGYFIIMGGYNGNDYLKNVWALDTTDENAVWIEKPSMSIPRFGFSIAKIHDEIIVCGGIGGWGNVEIFDGEVWRDGPKMPTERYEAAAVVIPMEFARSLN